MGKGRPQAMVFSTEKLFKKEKGRGKQSRTYVATKKSESNEWVLLLLFFGCCCCCVFLKCSSSPPLISGLPPPLE